MPKTQYIDTDMFEESISNSGLRIGFICDKLGISYQAFDKKRKGITPFRASEVCVLSDLLRMSEEDKIKIFCTKS